MPSRRTALRACLAAGLAGVAGCLSDAPPGSPSDHGTSTNQTVTETPTPSPATPGAIAWERALSGAVAGTPALDGDRLLVGTEDGTVAALSRADGGARWRFDGDKPVRGAPTVVGDTVLAVSGGVGHGDHQVVHGLDATSGERRWTFAPNDWWLDVLGTHDGTAFVATSDDAVGPSGQNLYALSLSDGAKRWSAEVGDNSGGLVTDETVYVPSTDVVDAVGHAGSRRWRWEGEEYQFRTLSVAGDTVAFATGRSPEDWAIRGLDAATGERRWTFDDWTAYTTRVAGGALFVGGERVARLDPQSGDPEWVADQRAALYDAPVADGTLYVAGRTAAAIAVDDGAIGWTRDLDVHLGRPVGLASDRLVVHSSASRDDRNRHVLALDTGSGETAWEFAGDEELTRPAVGRARACVAEAERVVALAV